MSRKGDLMWQAQYGPIGQRDDARRQVRDMAGQEQPTPTDDDEERARARRLLNVPDPNPDADAPGRAQRAGSALFEHHYGTGRRWTGFGATE